MSYDPHTGVFVWLRRPCKNLKAGIEAGNLQPTGYRVIRIGGSLYKAHRLAWLYVHGHWPSDEIDHINGDKSDNRIANLRNVTHRQNMENRRHAHRNNRNGVLGVCPDGRKYSARIRAGGAQIHLGNFASVEEAGAAYLAAKRQLHAGGTL
jgi:hypothetical protein